MSFMHAEQRTARTVMAIGLGLVVAAASAVGAVRIGVAATDGLSADVRAVSAPSALFLHVLLLCLVPLLLWLALATTAASTDIARALRAGYQPGEPRQSGSGATGRRHVAALLLALTGAGALGSLPSATASASPLPPRTTQSAPITSAMDVPVPTTPPAPPTTDIPQPGWVTPAPSPTSQRCAAGARLIAGCPSREDAADVVVHRGDSLWSLISRHLHTHDPVVIAAALPHWYAANRAVIGPDPDVLRVGQRLHIPDPALTTSTTEHTTQGER